METKNPKHRLVDENHTKLRVFKLLTQKPPKNKRHTPRGGRRTCYQFIRGSGDGDVVLMSMGSCVGAEDRDKARKKRIGPCPCGYAAPQDFLAC